VEVAAIDIAPILCTVVISLPVLNQHEMVEATDISGNGKTGTITGATYTTDVPMKLRTLAGSRTAV